MFCPSTSVARTQPDTQSGMHQPGCLLAFNLPCLGRFDIYGTCPRVAKCFENCFKMLRKHFFHRIKRVGSRAWVCSRWSAVSSTSWVYRTLQLQLQLHYSTPHYIQHVLARWPLQPWQPLQKTQLPFGLSVDSPWHPCITTFHLL